MLQGEGKFWGLSSSFESIGSLAEVYAKTAEPIEFPFWGADSRGPNEPCIRWGRDPPWKGAIVGGYLAYSKVSAVSAVVFGCLQQKGSFSPQ